MVKFEFYISDKDFDLLMELKEKQGKYNLTGNEYAKELLEYKLYDLKKELKEKDNERK